MGTSSSKAETSKRIAWAMPSWCVDHVFFYNQFYYFLFELLPDAKKLFTKGMKAQGRMLANVIKYIITNLKEADESILKHSLEHLARVHNERGITADQYSVMGMCLVHTVRICTGAEFWTNEHRDAWVHIYSKMMSVIIPIVISGDMPEGAETKGAAVASLEYYKQGNMNAEADAPSTSHSPTPPKTGVTKTQPASCPASRMGAAGSDDIELSHEAKAHLQENASNHLEVLGAEQNAAAAATAAESKYKVLSRVLAISQRVEAHLRDAAAMAKGGSLLPPGQITGHQLLQLLHSQNWVSDASGARMAASYFLQLHLMTRLDESVESAAATSGALSLDSNAALSFPDDATVYSFTNAMASLTPPPSGGARGSKSGNTLDVQIIAPLQKSGSSDFLPTCYTADLLPASGILNALSPSPMPGLADVQE